MIEEDADAILRYVASNGLVANQSKTVLMIMNRKKDKNNEADLVKIRVGNTMIKLKDNFR